MALVMGKQWVSNAPKEENITNYNIVNQQNNQPCVLMMGNSRKIKKGKIELLLKQGIIIK